MAEDIEKNADVGSKSQPTNSADSRTNNYRSFVSGFTFAKEGGGTGGYGDRIRDKKRKEDGKFKEGFRKPEHVFLIYITLKDFSLVVRQVEAPLENKSLKVVEQNLFEVAKKGAGGIQTNFQNMIWGQPCYITVVLGMPKEDKPVWDFYWVEEDLDHSPIRFHRRKDIHGHGSKIFAQNYSFYDAEKFEFTDGSDKKYNGFRCINYINTEFGHLGAERELDYCFEIFLKVPLFHGNYITMLVDPDGQNQGPRTA